MNELITKTITYMLSNKNKSSIDDLRKQPFWDFTIPAILCTGTQPYATMSCDNLRLTPFGIDQANRAKPITLVPHVPSATKLTIPKGSSYIGDTKIIDYAITKSKNVLIEGPTGCGKTTLIESKSDDNKKRLWTVNCDTELDKTELIGHYQVKDGDTSWTYGIVPTAMKNGDYLVFDEINFARQGILSVLNQALDHRRQITLKEHDNEVITAHKDFRCFATMNPDYEGTLELNEALRRRFAVIITMGYLGGARERDLLINRTGISKDNAARLVEIGYSLRRLKRDDAITHDISTGHLLELAEMIQNGFDPLIAATATLNATNDKGEMTDILNVVRNYFKSVGVEAQGKEEQ